MAPRNGQPLVPSSLHSALPARSLSSEQVYWVKITKENQNDKLESSAEWNTHVESGRQRVAEGVRYCFLACACVFEP